MRLNLKKSIAVAVTALTLTAGVAATSQSAFAGPGQVWHHGGYYGGHWRGGWWGPAIGLGLLGGLVAGAAIANGPGYAPGYAPGPRPYDGGQCWQPRPIYDAWGRYIGTQPVNVCQ